MQKSAVKPYFPAEEVVREAEEPEERVCLNFKDNVVGEYTLYGNRTVIQLDKDVLGGMGAGVELTKLIKKGTMEKRQNQTFLINYKL